jgi:hypothetical protein
MKIDEMIRKWGIELAEQNGQPAHLIRGKASANQVEELKAAKAAIIEKLQQREQKFAEIIAKQEAEKAAELEAIMTGEKNIKLAYHDGEYLSGWAPVGESTGIMERLGLSKYVSGWGAYIEPGTIEALGGPEFTYRQVVEVSARIAAEKAAKAAEKEAARQEKFRQAKETGEPVLLRSWNTDCCSRDEECDLDNHYEHAMPDGTVKHTWNHTW